MRPRPSASDGFSASLGADFRALATTIVPEIAGLDEEGWGAVRGGIDDALAARPESLRRQLRLFIRLLGWLSLARHGTRLAALDAPLRERLLSSVERSRLLPIRRGFWGLRTLVFLGYWTRPEAAAAIGYRAQARGWEARR
jgi:hypothetical protein